MGLYFACVYHEVLFFSLFNVNYIHSMYTIPVYYTFLLTALISKMEHQALMFVCGLGIITVQATLMISNHQNYQD
jgi:hypothetical protein